MEFDRGVDGIFIACSRFLSQNTRFSIRNIAQGLVLKVPYFLTSFYQILVLKVP